MNEKESYDAFGAGARAEAHARRRRIRERHVCPSTSTNESDRTRVRFDSHSHSNDESKRKERPSRGARAPFEFDPVDGARARWRANAGDESEPRRANAVVRNEERPRKSTTSSLEAFDALAYVTRAHAKTSLETLRAAIERASGTERETSDRRRRVVGEHLPSFLSCLDAVEDARRALRTGMEEDGGEDGACAELERRLEESARRARASARHVIELEKKMMKITRVMRAMVRHKDAFEAPRVIREHLAAREYAEAASARERFRAAFGDQLSSSYVLSEIDREIEGDVKAAEDLIAERLHAGALADAQAEKHVRALNVLRACRQVASADDDRDASAAHVYIDRVVVHVCEDVSASMNVDEASEKCRLSIARVAKLTARMDVARSEHAHQALEKVQIAYIDMAKKSFDEISSSRAETHVGRRIDGLFEKCKSMARIGRALATTYNKLCEIVRIEHLGPLQQQNMRFCVSVRVHLELAWKLATTTFDLSSENVNAVTEALVQDARLVLKIANLYWYHADVSDLKSVECARDVESLLEALYATFGATLARVHEESARRGSGAALRALAFASVVIHECADFKRQFPALFALAPAADAARVAFEDASADMTKQLVSAFVDEHMRDELRPLIKIFFDPARERASAAGARITNTCEKIIKCMALMCRSSLSVTPTQASQIMETATSDVIDTLLAELTAVIGREGTPPITLTHFSFDFDFIRVALEPMSSKSARDGALRLVELTSRADRDRIARLDGEIARLSVYLRILGRGSS